MPTTLRRCQFGPVPCTAIIPEVSRGAVVLIHGYGGCKSEMLGLAVRVAEMDLAAYAVDLRGHGSNPAAMDEGLTADVEVAIAYARREGRVAAIGHSLGGRLALVSSADFAIGVSPALASSYGTRTRTILGATRDGRVRQAHTGVVFSALADLPGFEPRPERPVTILYGSRDFPEIAGACRMWEERGVPTLEIENARHADICFLEATSEAVAKALAAWLPSFS